MADINITITIPEALAPRIQQALGVSTKAQFEAWVKTQVKNEVVSYESQEAYRAKEADVVTAKQAQTNASQQAVNQAESDIVL